MSQNRDIIYLTDRERKPLFITVEDEYHSDWATLEMMGEYYMETLRDNMKENKKPRSVVAFREKSQKRAIKTFNECFEYWKAKRLRISKKTLKKSQKPSKSKKITKNLKNQKKPQEI